MQKCRADPLTQSEILAKDIHTFSVDLRPFLLCVIETLDKRFFQAASHCVAPSGALFVCFELFVVLELLDYMIRLVEMLRGAYHLPHQLLPLVADHSGCTVAVPAAAVE